MNILILMGDQRRCDAPGCAAAGIAPQERVRGNATAPPARAAS